MCNTWWENFASMCVFAWRSAWFLAADLGRLRRHSIAMGVAHNEIQWGKLVWTHCWIDHMHFFARKWRTLSKFFCFAMEGSHRRLKRTLRNSGGPSLLRGRLRVQAVSDNHTMDDSVASHGSDATKRAQCGQGPNRCTKVREPYQKTASNRGAAPPDPRVAFPMSQETDVRTNTTLNHCCLWPG